MRASLADELGLFVVAMAIANFHLDSPKMVNDIRYSARMKCVIPESLFPRGQVDARGWDAALDVVQQSVFTKARGNDVKNDEDQLLREVYWECK